MTPCDSDGPDGSVPADADAATDASGDPTRPERLLAAVQDAALERALLDDADAARHLALAGGLERARRVAADGDAPGRSGPFGPALLAVTTLAAFDGPGRDDLPTSPGTVSPEHSPVAPAPTVVSDDDAVVEGATLAVRRFDADVRRVAALADVPVATLTRRTESSPERR